MRRSLFQLLLLTVPAFALDSIKGTVKDPSGAPVPGASVRLEAVAGGGGRGVIVTRTDGRFAFDDVPQERTLLVVDAPHFERFVKTVSPGGQEVAVNLSLNRLAQQVAVTASGYLEDLDDSARATFALGRTELDRRLEFSVAESLREVPGVRITQLGGPGSQTNIRIRGLRAQDTAVLIDGMRFRDPAAIQADASAFVAELLTLSISRLEVLRGCGSALYGSNAMGGVVNIVSDSGGGTLRGDFLSEGGGLGFLRSQFRLSGGVAQNRLTYSLGLAHVNVMEGVDGDDRSRNSGIQSYFQYRARPTLLFSARFSANNTFLGVNLSPALTTNAGPAGSAVVAIPLPDAEQAKRQQGLPFALGNATVFPAANDPDSRRASWLASALFAADQQLTPRLNYRVAYQLVDTRRSFPNGPAGIGFQPVVGEVSTFDGRVDTVQGRVNWMGMRHQFSGGGEWEREAFHNGGLSRAVNPTANSAFRAQVSQRSFAAFGEDRWRFLDSRLQVTFSGRVQKFDLSHPRLSGDLPAYLSGVPPNPPAAYTGDASIMYRLDKANTKLRAHLGNAFRAPSLYERYGTGYFGGTFTPYGDPRLKPERSMGGDFGIDRYFGQRRARLSATYFYTQLRSFVGFDFSGIINRTTDPFGRNSGYFSTNGGLARGVELEGQAALWKGFQLTGSYTHTRTLERRAIAAGSLRTPRIYAHTMALAGSQTWKQLTFTANFFGAPEFLGVISGRAVYWPGPKRLDATGSYRLSLGERLKPELFARVENLLGQRYYEDGYRTPRRWALAGFRFSF